MEIRESVHQKRLEVQWEIMDLIISLKQRSPIDFESSYERQGYYLFLPAILLIGFLFVGLFVLLRYSFLTYDPLEFLIYSYTTENWQRFIETQAVHSIFQRTLSYSIITTVLTVGLAIPYAYIIIRTDRKVFQYLLMVALFVPFFTGPIIRAYGWLIVMGQNGIVNWLLNTFGSNPVDLIGSDLAVIIGLVHHMFAYAVLMLSPAIANINQDLERAASNLGANRWETFRYVILPLAKPGLTSATVVVFSITMVTFAIPQLLGAGSKDVVSNRIFTKLFADGNYPFAAVLSLVLLLLTSVFVVIIFRLYGMGQLSFDQEAA
ncbi:ABC transporter permease [Halopenitus persicus]|uniref:Putative spermidine/putrescine transport system permease protein n=1 Tax=Halopenitus persicus TaxID=1048396 RepID=A0A1H3P9Y8_9EURY|nr:ABC transporter permease [Halopenitus persicus]SDY97942.1 putative spermidine/putrescine transport system permease protein [Halopenitus persicus]